MGLNSIILQKMPKCVKTLVTALRVPLLFFFRSYRILMSSMIYYRKYELQRYHSVLLTVKDLDLSLFF